MTSAYNLEPKLKEAAVTLFGLQAHATGYLKNVNVYASRGLGYIKIALSGKIHNDRYIRLEYLHPVSEDQGIEDIDEKHLFDCCIRSWVIDYANDLLYPNGGYLGSD